MKSRYNELFDNITPPRSDEEMLRAVLSADRETALQSEPDASPRKLRFRKPTIIAAAVAAVSVGVTAAGAASGWNFPKLFEGFYNRISTEHAGYVDTNIENQPITADLSGMGIDLSQTVDFGCGSVTFTGAIADSSVVMLTYDITVDKEIIEQYNPENRKMWVYLSSMEFPEGCKKSTSFPGGSEGNIFTRVCSYEYFEYMSKSKPLTTDDVINISYDTLGLMISQSITEEISLDPPVELSIPLDFINTERIAVSPNVEITHDNYRYFLEDVVITPLSIQWYTQPGEKMGNLPLQSEPLIYRFKDGTEVKNYGITETTESSGSKPRLEFHSALLEKPIDPSDLVSVTIGDYTINL